MSYEKLLSGYQGQDYGKLLERVYGKEKVTPVEEAPIIAAPAPVPAAHTGREVSSILGSDPFGNDIILNKRQMERLLYLLGVSGAGKSTMLLNLILQNIEQGYGVCVLDPHGSLVEDVIVSLPEPRRKDVILLDLTNTKEYVFGLNLYQCDDVTDLDKVQRTMERIMHVWERLFRVSRDTPQIVQYMRKCAQTIIPNPGYTMAEIPLLFNNIPFRNKLLLNVADREVHDFWEDYDKDTKTDQMHNKGSILRKLDEFLVPIVKGIIGQSTSTVNMWDIINASPAKILLVRLDNDMKGITSLIGSVVVAMIRSAAFFRQFMPEKDRKHFYLYADEFANFATEDFQDIIEQTRKYYVFPVCAHQTRGVLRREVPALVEGTLQGNLVVFPGINDVDAREMAGNYNFTPEPEEIGKRNKEAPVKDVVGHLLNKGSHSSPVVNQFAVGTLTDFDVFGKGVSWMQECLSFLNRILYAAMTYDIPAQHPSSLDFFSAICCPLQISLFSHTLRPHYQDRVFDEQLYKSLLLGDKEVCEAALANVISMVKKCTKEMELSKVYTAVYGVQHKYREYCYNFVVDASTRTRSGCYTPKEWVASYYQQEGVYISVQGSSERHTGRFDRKFYHGWYHVKPEILAWEETAFVVNIDKYWGNTREDEAKYKWRLVPGQAKQFYKEEELDRVVEEEIQEEIVVFESFIWELRSVMQALANNPPIMGDSGEEEIIYKKGSYDDKKAEIANKLSGDPDYTAFVRVGGAIQYCWHCGKKPDPSDKKCQDCQKELKHEYRVSATPVQKDASVSVDVIIAGIVKQNVEDKYLRLRSEVEKEILERQQPDEKQEAGIPDKVENKPAPPGAGLLVPGASRRKGKKGE